MKKTPFNAITEIFYNQIAEQKENAIFKYSQIDKILVWIVGFAITGFSLIISNKIDFEELYEKETILVILSLLLLCILSGIIYRVSSLFSVNHFQQLIFKLKGSFMSDEMMNTEPLDEEIDNITFINNEIFINYGHNYDEIVQRYYSTQDENEKELLLKYLIKEHNALASVAKKGEEYSSEYVLSTYKSIFGINDNQLKKVQNTNNTYLFKLWEKFRVGSLIVTIVSFIAVLLIMFIGFIIDYSQNIG